MPTIDLIAIDSITHINTENIAPGKPTILFAFEPWCPYCKAQTTSMLAQIKKLKDVNIYMLCKSKYGEFKKFYDKYELQKYPNIKAGIDYRYGFIKYFKIRGIPCLAIYNKDKRLKQGKPSSNPIVGQTDFIVKKLYRLLTLCGDVFSCSSIIALGDKYFCSVYSTPVKRTYASLFLQQSISTFKGRH